MPTTLRVLLLALTVALPLAAQTQTPPASAEKESFLVQPKNVTAGAKDVALRLAANNSSGFNTSSSRPPEVKFSAGATLKSGTFVLLNTNEAECRIDVADDAFGTIEVSLVLYSVNGSKVLRTLRGTMGIAGAAAVAGSQAKVGAEGVELVRVNVSQPQTAGAILITGKVNGSVSITAPTGTLFSRAPVVTTSSGSINVPQLASANTVFNFTIGNAALDDVTVRVTEIQLNTQLFSVGGGAEGQLACEVTGSALAGQTALVVNAHTARTTIEGANDNAEAAPEQPKTDQTPADTTNPASGTGASLNNDRRSLDGEGGRNRENRNNQSFPGASRGPGGVPQGGQAQQPRPMPSQVGQAGAPGGQPAPPQPPVGGGQSPAASGVPGPAGERPFSDGSARQATDEDAPRRDTSGSRLPVVEGTRLLHVSPGLYFCNRDFKPLGAVVLDKAVAGEAGGRVWVMLKRDSDKDPTKVETITVKLTVSGVTRELLLTETGKDTGEFRCGAEGVLLLSPDNPDSNLEAEAESAPKARVR